jgi:hypothetical protein
MRGILALGLSAMLIAPAAADDAARPDGGVAAGGRGQPQRAGPPAQRAAPATDEGGQPMSHERAIRSMAQDIEALAARFPQLADFDAERHCDTEDLSIGYAYHTHRPEGRPGWAGAVPNPDPDGIWFHIDLYDPDSTAQIHTQPMVPRLQRGDKRVQLLILEGEKTRKLHAELWRILQKHGARPAAATGDWD